MLEYLASRRDKIEMFSNIPNKAKAKAIVLVN